MTLVLALLVLAGAAGALGVIFGIAYGIEHERAARPRLRVVEKEARQGADER